MKKGKLILMLLFLPIFALNILAQSENASSVIPDKRISDAFGEEFVSQLVIENQNLILYYNFYLDNAYVISELPADKSDFLNNLTSLKIDPQSNKSDINILSLDLDLNFEQKTYYRISDSQNVMVFYSGTELTEMFNEHRRSLGLINNDLIK